MIDGGCLEYCIERHSEAAYELREKEGCDQLGVSTMSTHGKIKHSCHIFTIPQHHYPEKQEFVSDFKVTFEKNGLLPLRIPILHLLFGEDTSLYRTLGN